MRQRLRRHAEESTAAAVLWLLSGDAGQRPLIAWHMGWAPALEASGRDWLAPYLLTQHWNDFGELLRDPVSLGGLRPGLLSAGAYIVIFLCAAWARFGGRDITS